MVDIVCNTECSLEKVPHFFHISQPPDKSIKSIAHAVCRSESEMRIDDVFVIQVQVE